MNRESIQADGKKPYEPPAVKTISLRPEEAVLGHCKVLGAGGSSQVCGFTCPNAGS